MANLRQCHYERHHRWPGAPLPSRCFHRAARSRAGRPPKQHSVHIRFALWATVLIQANQGLVIGNGRLASEQRPIAAATAINIDGNFEISIMVGQSPMLMVEDDKNILPIIKTSVANGQLDISSDRSYSVKRWIRVMVSTLHIPNLSASGSNRIEGKNFDWGSFRSCWTGPNNARLAGKVSALTCHANGSNHLSARQLMAGSVTVTIAGAGEASVDARERIFAEIFGSGSILVHGNPRDRQLSISGSGQITFCPMHADGSGITTDAQHRTPITRFSLSWGRRHL
jgi:hypothetical protein